MTPGAHIVKKTRQLIEYQKAPRRASTKNVGIVSISLKSDAFSPFGTSACTKNEEEPIFLSPWRPNPFARQLQQKTSYWERNADRSRECGHTGKQERYFRRFFRRWRICLEVIAECRILIGRGGTGPGLFCFRSEERGVGGRR